MAIAEYNWFNFFAFATAADTASLKIREEIEKQLEPIEYHSSQMAGNDEKVGQEWGKQWDEAINRLIPAACQLADAYGAISKRAYFAGVNQMYVEWYAGGRLGEIPAPPAAPQNTEQRVPYGNFKTSIGQPSGDPLRDVPVPGLIEQIGVPLPNANDVNLKYVGEAMKSLALAIREQTDAVRKYGFEPGARDCEAAHLLYDEYVESVLGPSGMIAQDTNTLASASTTFGEQVVNHRHAVKDAVSDLGVEATASLGVGLAGTFVSGGLSDAAGVAVTAARVTTCANRIRTTISTLATLARLARSTFTAVKLTNTAIQLMAKTVERPTNKVELGPDGRPKITITWSRWKEEAYQEYLKDCVTRRNGCVTREEWSRLYDQLRINELNGSEWDKKLWELNGYTEEDGWKREQYVEAIPGRRYDFVHYDEDGDPIELVENKSGALKSDQLVKDEAALEKGFNVTYNLESPLSQADSAKLERLESMYPGQFTVNRYYN
ncbi:hypothetical protein AB0J48_32280 [Nocardia salmonicida]|uniref:hypothetical protein n=1 Tax=Nocardia salmonicida TaxID=53431 RepID=UPI0034375826